jgi:hypothetical protein
MPKYRITAPDGNSYDITAPEGTTQEAALEYFKSNYKPSATSTGTTQPPVAAPPHDEEADVQQPSPQRPVATAGREMLGPPAPEAPLQPPAVAGTEMLGPSPELIKRRIRRQRMEEEMGFEAKAGDFYNYLSETVLGGLMKGTKPLVVTYENPLGPITGVPAVVAESTGLDKASLAASKAGGDIALSLVEDIGSGRLLTVGPTATADAFHRVGQNIEAPKPAPQGFVEKGLESSIRGGGQMIPALIANRFGVPMHVAFGTQMGLDAYAETKDPNYAARQASIGVLLGKAGELGNTIGQTAAANVASKLPAGLEGPAMEAGKLAGKLASLNLLMNIGNLPELASNPEKAGQMMLDTFGMTLAFELPALPAHLRNAIAKDGVDQFIASPEYKDYVNFVSARAGLPEAVNDKTDADINFALKIAAQNAEKAGSTATAAALEQQAEVLPSPAKEAPVVYKGFQEGVPEAGIPGFHLYDLTEELGPKLVKGSTVTEAKLKEAGYSIPAAEKAKEVQLEAKKVAAPKPPEVSPEMQSAIDETKAQVATDEQAIADKRAILRRIALEEDPQGKAPGLLRDLKVLTDRVAENKKWLAENAPTELELPRQEKPAPAAETKPAPKPEAADTKQPELPIQETPATEPKPAPAKKAETPKSVVPQEGNSFYGPDGPVDVIGQSNDGRRFLTRAAGNPSAPLVEIPKNRLTERPRRPKGAEPAGKVTEESPEDKAEREAIDEAAKGNMEQGLPADVEIAGEEAGNEPFARANKGNIAWATPQGRIVINRPEFRRWIRSVPESRRQQAIASLLSEEGIHAAARKAIGDSELAGLWNSLTEAERALVRKSYGFDLNDVQMGHEYLRRQMQRLMKSPLREVAESKGFDRLTQKTIDIIERIIASVRRMVGSNASKELDSLLNRMEQGLKKAGVVSEETPLARRRGKEEEVPKEQLGFGLGTPQERVTPEERVSAEEARASTNLPFTPKTIEDLAGEVVAGNIKQGREQGLLKGVEGKPERARIPSFKTFKEELQKTYGIQPGDVLEHWRDAVWKWVEEKLSKIPVPTEDVRVVKEDKARESVELNAAAQQARARAEKFREQAAASTVLGERLGFEAKAIDEEASARRLERKSDIAYRASRNVKALDYKPGESRPESWIADRAIRLLDQAKTGEETLTRSKVIGDDIRKTESSYKREASFEEQDVTPEDRKPWTDFSKSDLKDPLLGPRMASGGAMDRTSRVVEDFGAGEKRLVSKSVTPASHTKRVVALRDLETGKVELLGAYTDKEARRITDPAKSHLPNTETSRKSSPIDEVLNRRYTGKDGKLHQKYEPVGMGLLDEPTRNFRQTFKTEADFDADFANRAREISEEASRTEEAPIADEEFIKTLPKSKQAAALADLHGEGRNLSGRPLTDLEASALHFTIESEVGRIDSAEDVADTISALKDKAEAGTLKAVDWAAINALDKIGADTERKNPKLTPDEIFELTKQRIADLAFNARTGDEFSRRSLSEFTEEGGTVVPNVAAEPEPSATEAEVRRLARQRTARETIAAERAAQRANLDAALERMAITTGGERAVRRLVENMPPKVEEAVAATDAPMPELLADPNAPFAMNRPVPPPGAPLGERVRRATIGALRTGLNKTLFALGRIQSEWMTDRLRRVAESLPIYQRREIERVTALANEVISRQHAFRGDMDRRFGDVIKGVAGKSGLPFYWKSPPAWLNDIQEVIPKETAIRNLREAVEGRIRAPDERTQRAVEEAQQANLLIGDMLEPVAPGFLANGGMASNWTKLMFDIVKKGSGPEWEKIIRGNAAANGISIATTRNMFNSLRSRLLQPGVDSVTLASVAQDFTRNFPRAVTDIWTGEIGGKLGHWEPVIHANFFDYFDNGIRKAAAIRAFREIWPRDSVNAAPPGRPPVMVNALSRDYNALRRNVPPEYHGLVDSLFRVLQGQPSEGGFGQPGIVGGLESALSEFSISPAGLAARGLWDAVRPIIRAGMLSRQIALQPSELMSGASHVFFGYRNSAANTFARFSKDYGMLEQRGMVDRMLYNDSFDPTSPVRSFGRAASNFIRRVGIENAVNEMQEAQNAAASAVVARQIQDAAAGGPPLPRAQEKNLRKVFEYMGFTKPEIELMMNGNEVLLNQMQRKAASFLSGGNKAAGERSRLLSSRAFQQAFWFQDYPATRINQFIKIADTMLKDAEQGRWDEAATGAKFMAKFVGGTTLQGVLTAGIMALFAGGIYGLRSKRDEFLDEPASFLLAAQRASIGGPMQAALDGMNDQGWHGFVDNMKNLATPTPAGLAYDIHNAVTGKGQYRDMPAWDRMARFAANRAPGSQMFTTGIAAELLNKAPDYRKLQLSMRSFYAWRRKEFGTVAYDVWLDDDYKQAFRTDMRKVKDALMKGDIDAFENAKWDSINTAVEEIEHAKELGTKMPKPVQKREAGRKQPAITQEAKQKVGRGLESAYILKVPAGPTTSRPMTYEENQKLRNHIGNEAVDRMEDFDRMIALMGQKTARKQGAAR